VDSAVVIEQLGIVIPELLDREVPRETRRVGGVCILASRLGLGVLRHYGIPAEPVVLSFIAANQEWLEWRAKWDVDGVFAPEEPMPDGAWSVAGGFDQGGPGGYDAHLALAVGEGGYLLCDFDAVQMDRPQHGIHVPTSVIVPWDGQAAWVALADGGAIAYGLHVGTNVANFRLAPDWVKGARLITPAIRELRARLNSSAMIEPPTEEA
jgi:hypothetical protein